MSPDESSALACRARAIYQDRLRTRLEREEPDRFVAIEPESGDYYLGETLSEAVQAARAAYPNRLSFALRVGHTTTIELGVVLS